MSNATWALFIISAIYMAQTMEKRTSTFYALAFMSVAIISSLFEIYERI